MYKDGYKSVFENYSGAQDNLISLLQHFQKQSGYISQECVQEVARFLKISENHIYGVASFYSQFTFQKPGKNHIKVCLGTACHVQDGQLLANEIRDLLGIQSGQVTADGFFDYQEVACLGCCAQAPVVEINGQIYARMTTTKLMKKLSEYE
ncbi:MAG: NAD(P)H-dependent oxidoreductase subunit E [Anaerolineae bacterium]|nr:NAD(P)H-dependent oxidoreductase subunit E [Anaerolineae bacterium]